MTGWKQLMISEPIFEALRATGEVIASEPTGLALCLSLLARKPLRGPTAWATKPPKWALEAHFIKQADALEAAERKRIYDSSDFDTLDGDLTGVFFS